jgi:hypothetical protein
MRKPEAQQLDTRIAHLKDTIPGNGSECVEEPSRALQIRLLQRFRRHERIRLLILGMGLLVIMLSIVCFVFSGTILPLFATIVVVPLCYWCVDRYLNTSETATHVT